MQSLLFHVITLRDIDELEIFYALVVEDAMRLHWTDERRIQGDAQRLAVPRRLPCSHPMAYSSYDVAMYHMNRVKGSLESDGPEHYRLRLIACILFATHVSTHAYMILYTYGAVNDYTGKPAPSYAIATYGFRELHDIAVFYRSVFGIDPESPETRETLQCDAMRQREAVLAFCLAMRRCIWNLSAMNVAPPILVSD